MTADDRSYVAQLGEALRRRDVAVLRAFLEAQAGRYGDERQVEAIRAQSDAEIEALLHRMIVSRPDLAALHAESQRWLSGQAGPGRQGQQPAGTPPARPPGRRPRGPGGSRRRPPDRA
ncbi:MAG TPA: hypothetical protein VFH48_04565 [Chloroflexota bacterium]|nr:hypothetical protein [Chloroflexota bacterium]